MSGNADMVRLGRVRFALGMAYGFARVASIAMQRIHGLGNAK
jgi:hypothetical protein